MAAGRLSLRGADVVVEVDPRHGARLSSLRLGGRERLVTASDDVLGWGAYPMVPFAGRLRDGELRVGDTTYRLPPSSDGHAIHGTVLDTAWDVVDVADERALLRVALGDPWPFSGEVEHEVRIVDGDVSCRLTVRAAEPMPAQVGWHPWFLRPERLDLPFASMLRRDAAGIPDGSVVATPRGPFDDCFVAEGRAATLTWNDGWSLSVESDCSHVVVYDAPAHAVCIEPQSGPPNGVNDSPATIPAGDTLERSMSLRVRPPGRRASREFRGP